MAGEVLRPLAILVAEGGAGLRALQVDDAARGVTVADRRTQNGFDAPPDDTRLEARIQERRRRDDRSTRRQGERDAAARDARADTVDRLGRKAVRDPPAGLAVGRVGG